MAGAAPANVGGAAAPGRGGRNRYGSRCRRRCGSGSLFIPHARRVNGAVRSYRDCGNFPLRRLIEYESFTSGRDAQDQPAGVGADNQVCHWDRWRAKRACVSSVLKKHTSGAGAGHAMDFALIACGDKQIARSGRTPWPKCISVSGRRRLLIFRTRRRDKLSHRAMSPHRTRSLESTAMAWMAIPSSSAKVFRFARWIDHEQLRFGAA